MAAFGEDLARLALSDKWLMTVGKQLIRPQTQASMTRKQKRSQKDLEELQLSPSKRHRKRKSMSERNDTQVPDAPICSHCVNMQQCSPGAGSHTALQACKQAKSIQGHPARDLQLTLGCTH